MRSITSILAITLLLAAQGSAFAQQNQGKKVELFPKDTRTHAEKEQARSEAQAKAGYEAVQRQKQAEAMRDKRHDNRVKVGPNTSVGVQGDPAGVNVRTTTK